MSDKVTIQDKFTAPCEQFPDGRWEQRIADGEWRDMLSPGQKVPVVFFDSRIAFTTQTSEVPAEHAPMT